MSIYYHDYPNEKIGGGNPYYRCSFCGVSDPEINGRLEGHSSSCEYRIKKEKALQAPQNLKDTVAFRLAELNIIPDRVSLTGDDSWLFEFLDLDGSKKFISCIDIYPSGVIVIGRITDYDIEDENRLFQEFSLDEIDIAIKTSQEFPPIEKF